MKQRLYCIIRKDLTYGQITAQACHAATQYLIDNPGTKWDNGFIICLEVENEACLIELKDKLLKEEKLHSKFHEPDMDNSLTAISSLDCGKTFKHLKLLR